MTHKNPSLDICDAFKEKVAVAKHFVKMILYTDMIPNTLILTLILYKS